MRGLAVHATVHDWERVLWDVIREQQDALFPKGELIRRAGRRVGFEKPLPSHPDALRALNNLLIRMKIEEVAFPGRGQSHGYREVGSTVRKKWVVEVPTLRPIEVSDSPTSNGTSGYSGGVTMREESAPEWSYLNLPDAQRRVFMEMEARIRRLEQESRRLQEELARVAALLEEPHRVRLALLALLREEGARRRGDLVVDRDDTLSLCAAVKEATC